MKIKIGDIVYSEDGHGPVVAMTKEWCIYKDEDGHEVAWPWEDVWLDAEPSETMSPLKEKDL